MLEVFKPLRRIQTKVEGRIQDESIFSDTAFRELYEFACAIDDVSRGIGLSIKEVLRIGVLRDPYEILESSIQAWEEKIKEASGVVSDSALIEKLKTSMKIPVIESEEIFIPPDEMELAEGSLRKPYANENADDVSRVMFVLDVLLHTKIAGEDLRMDDIEITLSKKPKSGWRTNAYWSFRIRKWALVVLVDNQYGNATFVAQCQDDRQYHFISRQTKSSLKQHGREKPLVHYFMYHDEAQFKAKLILALEAVRNGQEMPRFYENVEEASEAAQRLGIATWEEYQQRYREDPRLPSHPDGVYGDYFPGFSEFLRGEKPQEFYETVEEAREAARRIGIATKEEYQQRYREDPHLPSDPKKFYGDNFPRWKIFLGTNN